MCVFSNARNRDETVRVRVKKARRMQSVTHRGPGAEREALSRASSSVTHSVETHVVDWYPCSTLSPVLHCAHMVPAALCRLGSHRRAPGLRSRLAANANALARLTPACGPPPRIPLGLAAVRGTANRAGRYGRRRCARTTARTAARMPTLTPGCWLPTTRTRPTTHTAGWRPGPRSVPVWLAVFLR